MLLSFDDHQSYIWILKPCCIQFYQFFFLRWVEKPLQCISKKLLKWNNVQTVHLKIKSFIVFIWLLYYSFYSRDSKLSEKRKRLYLFELKAFIVITLVPRTKVYCFDWIVLDNFINRNCFKWLLIVKGW